MPLANASESTNSGLGVLEFRAVEKHFQSGKRIISAVEAVSFQIQPGIVTGLIGPDGAGKTTLMRLAAGLLLPNCGEIRVLGIDVARDPQRVQSSIGYMPQRFGLYEDLSVQENLDLYADLQGVSPDKRLKRYEVLMRMTNLTPYIKRLAGRLSGGMKQKLGLACALIRSPRLILLDEPTVGVDPVSRRELWAIVYGLVENEGISVLLSTAYLDEAQRCRNVILMYNGKILGQGPPEQFSKPLTGRIFQVSAIGIKNRTLAHRLGTTTQVMDAVIIGDGVRTIIQRSTGSLERLRTAFPEATIVPVEPRFEDGFIDAMRSKIEPKGISVQTIHGELVPASSGQVAIEVKDVFKIFGKFHAVDGITFSVMRGEIFGLLGANGAGKSTTFRMLCGLLPASGGFLRVANQDLRTARAAARERIGYMSQKFSLYGSLSVLENLRFFSSAYGLRGALRTSRIDEVMHEFELDSMADVNSSNLPLGFKQRLSLAAALMHKPEILFLDEPTSGVDPLARREFWHRINDLVNSGVTVMVTTHFMEEAEYCDRLAVMAEGKILALGTPAELRRGAISSDQDNPTMEDAFISLIDSNQNKKDE